MFFARESVYGKYPYQYYHIRQSKLRLQKQKGNKDIGRIKINSVHNPR